MATTPNPASGVPVSSARIENCLRSAGFWVNELPRYADRQQVKADFWAIPPASSPRSRASPSFPCSANADDRGEVVVSACRVAQRHLRPRTAGQELRRDGGPGAGAEQPLRGHRTATSSTSPSRRRSTRSAPRRSSRSSSRSSRRRTGCAGCRIARPRRSDAWRWHARSRRHGRGRLRLPERRPRPSERQTSPSALPADPPRPSSGSPKRPPSCCWNRRHRARRWCTID